MAPGLALAGLLLFAACGQERPGSSADGGPGDGHLKTVRLGLGETCADCSVEGCETDLGFQCVALPADPTVSVCAKTCATDAVCDEGHSCDQAEGFCVPDATTTCSFGNKFLTQSDTCGHTLGTISCGDFLCSLSNHQCPAEFCELCGADSECGSKSCILGEDAEDGYCTRDCDGGTPCPEGNWSCEKGICVGALSHECLDNDVWSVDACGRASGDVANDVCHEGFPCELNDLGKPFCPAAPSEQCGKCDGDDDCAAGLSCLTWSVPVQACEEVGLQPGCEDPRWCVSQCTSDAQCLGLTFCADGQCMPRWFQNCDDSGQAEINDGCSEYVGLVGCAEPPCACAEQPEPGCRACTTDDDCFKGYLCRAHVADPSATWCSQICTLDSDCPSGQTCETGGPGGAASCVPGTSTQCNEAGELASIDQCGQQVGASTACGPTQLCLETQCAEASACASCSSDEECLEGLGCVASAPAGVSYCAPACPDCDAGFTCQGGTCLADEAAACDGDQKVTADACGNTTEAGEVCPDGCLAGECADLGGQCATCATEDDCKADHDCVLTWPDTADKGCAKACNDQSDCAQDTTCTAGHCLPDSTTICTGEGAVEERDLCEHLLSGPTPCAPGEQCVLGICEPCSCTAGDPCCTNGCTADAPGTACGECQSCGLDGSCGSVQNTSDPFGDCSGAEVCVEGACCKDACGDGIVDAPCEECDEGDTEAGDGCSPSCKIEVDPCGNGEVDPGEDCDDGSGPGADTPGNVDDGDGCTALCTFTCSSDEACPDPGDCRRGDCAPGGVEGGQICFGETDEEDVPADDGDDNACTLPTCEGPVVGTAFADAGTSCADNSFCDDAGACLEDTCGNDLQGEGEECDDGAENADEPNKCRPATCLLPTCGDGIVDDLFGEACDDGEDPAGPDDAGDGCVDCQAVCPQDVGEDCTSLTCEVTEAGCECTEAVDTSDVEDDGNDCTIDSCNVVGEIATPLHTPDPTKVDEACSTDAGEAGWCQAGTGACVKNVCGDAKVADAEQCDDGDEDGTDECSNECVIQVCGNGVVDLAGEVCDDGQDGDPDDGCDDDCLPSCTTDDECVGEVADVNGNCRSPGCVPDESQTGAAACGLVDDATDLDVDGSVCTGDVCLAGETGLEPHHPAVADGTDCAAADDQDICIGGLCLTDTCGNGHEVAPEVCDDSNQVGGDGCSGDCLKVEVCGDGELDEGEDCDDGNGSNGDGCDDAAEPCRDTCVDPEADCTDVPGDCMVPACGDVDPAQPALGRVCVLVPGDDPPSDGDDCTADTCVAGVDEHPDADPGTKCVGPTSADHWCFAGVCTANICGDGFVGDEELCEPSLDPECLLVGSEDECTYPAFCGDGILDPGEECEANAQGAFDAVCKGPPTCHFLCHDPEPDCAADVEGDCKEPTCTDSHVCGLAPDPDDLPLDDPGTCLAPACNEQGFATSVADNEGGECQLLLGGAGYCKSGACVAHVVGDGVLGPDEECDDGNVTDCDGCSSGGETELCGDGKHASACESCDDGNLISGDGCEPDCTFTCQDPAGDCGSAPTCYRYICASGGTGKTCKKLPEPGQEPSDGNSCHQGSCANLLPEFETVGDGTPCESAAPTAWCLGGACTANQCGDGFKSAGEGCDDGNEVSGDGCDEDCVIESLFCGDGLKDPDEECDDQKDGDDGDGCTNQCTYTCQDPSGCAEVQGDCRTAACVGPEGVGKVCGEELDTSDVPGPAGPCLVGTCASGEPGQEAVEDGTSCGDGVICIEGTCTVPSCGDGIITAPEDCDDGNDEGGDGCSSECKEEGCGNGLLDAEAGEECDDGQNGDDGDGCTDACLFSCTDPDFTPCTDPAGDCMVRVCVETGLGQDCGFVPDGLDLPDDDNPCTADTCELGTPVFTATIDGAQCENDPSDNHVPGTDWCVSGLCVDNACGDGRIGDAEGCDVVGLPVESGCGTDCQPFVCGDGEWEGLEACEGSQGCFQCEPLCSTDEDCGESADPCAREACLPIGEQGGFSCQDVEVSGLVQDADDGCFALECPGESLSQLQVGAACTVFPSGLAGHCDEEALCQPNLCGDGIVHPGEACDPGGDKLTWTSCDTASCLPVLCLPPVGEDCCGNGVVESDPLGMDEQCDDDNGADDDGCTTLCRFSCQVNADCGEVAEADPCLQPLCIDLTDADGELVGRRCAPATDGTPCQGAGEAARWCLGGLCIENTCGDGFVAGPPSGTEQCDPAAQSGIDCAPNCLAAGCGNGLIEEELGEVCDDSNEASEDGCLGCQPECGPLAPCPEPADCGSVICQSAGFGAVCVQSSSGGTSDDSNDCTEDACVGSLATHTVLAAGTPCEDLTGLGLGFAWCDGQGTCVPDACGDGFKSPNEACDGGLGCAEGGCKFVSCGDGLLDPGEDCDEGEGTGAFTDDSDGCTKLCTFSCASDEDCADEAGDCDAAFCDKTSATAHLCVETFDAADVPPAADPCLVPSCDDEEGIVVTALEPGTPCAQDGTLSAFCNSAAACEPDTCGNGLKGEGEECDDGIDTSAGLFNALDSNALCRPDCTTRTCGDGIVDDLFGEVCDDGNAAGGDGCEPDCSPTCENPAIDCPQTAGDCHIPVCKEGDGLGQAICGLQEASSDVPVDAEPCVVGICKPGGSPASLDLPEGAPCTTTENLVGWCQEVSGVMTCVPPECGDGILNEDEGCDVKIHPGCSASCLIPTCGDAIVDDLEDCDDANSDDSDGCNTLCRFTCYDDEVPCLDCPLAFTICPDEPGDCKGPGFNCESKTDAGGKVLGRVCAVVPDPTDTPPFVDACSTPGCKGTDPFYAPSEELLICENDPSPLFEAGDDWCIETLCVDNSCGDGRIGDEEVCDDGNLVSHDGCSNECVPDGFCGDGFADLDEDCDDANKDATDGCTGACEFTCDPAVGCGDQDLPGDCAKPGCVAVEQPAQGFICGELPDPDDPLVDGDPCTADQCDGTTPENPVLPDGTQCDDTDPEDCAKGECSYCIGGTCTEADCGDGVLTPNEQCDEGAANGGDLCEEGCTLPGCGNGVLDLLEECDFGSDAMGAGTGCVDCIAECSVPELHCKGLDELGNCLQPICVPPADPGPGVGGVCSLGKDDGDVPVSEDACAVLSCVEGNLVAIPVKECSACAPGPGATPGFYKCVDGACSLSDCGDGCQAPDEQCDDSNETSEDGCSSGCLDEFCGDGVHQLGLGEDCDFKDPNAGPGCSTDCQYECTEDGECVCTGQPDCDYGPDDAGCWQSSCKNFACVHEPRSENTACTTGGKPGWCKGTLDPVCLENVCGDRLLAETAEVCDDGNDVEEDGCTTTCELSCDASADKLPCADEDVDGDCRQPVCVDMQIVEVDGSTHPGSYCDPTGQLAVDPPEDEACQTFDCTGGAPNPTNRDDGTPCEGGFCEEGLCVPDTCGNGLLGPGEECDTGKVDGSDADGCDDACQFVCDNDSDCASLNELGDCREYVCQAVAAELGGGKTCLARALPTDAPIDEACATYTCQDPLPEDPEAVAFVRTQEHAPDLASDAEGACIQPDSGVPGICWHGECVKDNEACLVDCPLEGHICAEGGTKCVALKARGGGCDGCSGGQGGALPSGGTMLAILALGWLLRRRPSARPRLARLPLGLILLAPLAGAPPAAAQSPPAADIELFRPSPHATDDLVVTTTKVLGHLEASAGTTASWSHVTLQIGDDESGITILDDRIRADLLASLGIGEVAEVGLALPVILLNRGLDDPLNGFDLETAGYGDLRVSAKTRILDGCGRLFGRWDAGFTPWLQSSVGARLETSLPTGDQSSLFGAPGLAFQPELLWTALWTSRLSTTIDLGARLRTANERVVGAKIGHEWTAALAASYAIVHGELYAQAGVRTALPLSFALADPFTNPFEVSGWARWIPFKGLQLLAGLGSGPFRSGYGVPDLRVMLGVHASFRVRPLAAPQDLDEDGIPDPWDRCVCSPEVL